MKIKTEIRNIKKRNPNADTVSKSRSISFDAKPAVDYVMSEKDHKGEKREHPPAIIQGDPDLTRELDKAFKSDVKVKSRSGIIGFKNNEERDKVDANEFVDRWKELVLGDLSPRLNCLFVEHREDPKSDAVDGGDHTHFHFVINLIDTETKNVLNPFDARPYDKSGGPMWIPAIEATERVMAYEFGLDQVVPKDHATNDMQRKLEKGYINEKSKNYEEVKMNVSSMVDMNKLADTLKKQHQPKDINELKELMLKEKNIHKITIKDKETWINYTNANGKTTNMKLTGRMWKKGTTFAVKQGVVQVAEQKPYDQASYLKDLAVINAYQKARVNYLNSRLSKTATPFVFTKVEPYKSIVLKKEQNITLLERVRKDTRNMFDGIKKELNKKKGGGAGGGGGGGDKQSIINQIAVLKGRLMDHSLDEHTRVNICKQIVELELQLEKMMMDEASKNQQEITQNIQHRFAKKPASIARPVKQATMPSNVKPTPTQVDKVNNQPNSLKKPVVVNQPDGRSVVREGNKQGITREQIDREVKVRSSLPATASQEAPAQPIVMPNTNALPVFTKVQSEADKQAIAQMKASSTMTDEKRKEIIKAYAMKKMMEKRNPPNSIPVVDKPDSIPAISQEEEEEFRKVKEILNFPKF